MPRSPTLYVGKRRWCLTALAENAGADVERVAAAWRACGSVIHRLTPEEHDKVFAAVSHLPHLLAYALVDDIANKPHADLLFQYAASGFRDFTRIAGSSPEMWRDISLANQPALLTELDAYLAQLTGLRAQLGGRRRRKASSKPCTRMPSRRATAVDQKRSKRPKGAAAAGPARIISIAPAQGRHAAH